MTITEAIGRLQKLRKRHGDVEVLADCEACGHATPVGIVIAVEETITVRLSGPLKVAT